MVKRWYCDDFNRLWYNLPLIKGARLQNYFEWTQKMWHAHKWLPSLSPSRVLGKSLVKPKVNFTGNLKSTAETRKFQQRWRNVRLCPPTRSNEGRHLWRQHVGPEDGCPHSVRDNTDQHRLKCRTSPGEDPLWVFGVLLTVFNTETPRKVTLNWRKAELSDFCDTFRTERVVIALL